MTSSSPDQFLLMEWEHYLLLTMYQAIMVRVFANGPGDWGSIPVQAMPKMALDATLLCTSL